MTTLAYKSNADAVLDRVEIRPRTRDENTQVRNRKDAVNLVRQIFAAAVADQAISFE